MRRIVRLLAILTTVGGTIWVTSARRRALATDRDVSDILWHDVRSIVTHRFDPLVMQLGLAGGRRSPWAVIEHIGRSSGAIHRTPIEPRLGDDQMFIPLPYGTDVQWVRNVLAAGHCRVQFHEVLFELDEPAIVLAEENTTLPAAVHQALDATAVHYLRLHVLDRAPGTFTNPPAEFTTHRVAAPVPELEIIHPTPEGEPVA